MLVSLNFVKHRHRCFSPQSETRNLLRYVRRLRNGVFDFNLYITDTHQVEKLDVLPPLTGGVVGGQTMVSIVCRLQPLLVEKS